MASNVETAAGGGGKKQDKKKKVESMFVNWSSPAMEKKVVV
jgi:hypothetical protein